MARAEVAPNPYDPPASPSAPTGKTGAREGKQALLCTGAAIALLALASLLPMRTPMMLGFAAAAFVAFVGGVRGIQSLARMARARPRVAGLGFVAAVVVAVLGNGLLSLGGALFALLATVEFRRGRQLRRFGRILLPRVNAGDAWAQLPLAPSADPALRAAVAAQWRENGRTEHASVAAFARLSLDLMALGAPPALLTAANRDAVDEIRHAELCFSLARALDGQSAGPAPFPEAAGARTLPPTRTLALAALAVDSLVDGALNEGVSARIIAKLARRSEEPAIRAMLKEIAADEGRHAAHGWDVVAWCLQEGGRPVADALRGAVAALPRTMRSPLPEGAQGGGWERLGIHGNALEADQFAAARAELVARVERMVGEVRAAA